MAPTLRDLVDVDELHAQLRAHIDTRFRGVVDIAPPQAVHPIPPLAEVSTQWAHAWVHQLDLNPHTAVNALAQVLFPATADRLPAEFWRTPLGVLVMHYIGHPRAVVTLAETGRILGCTDARVAQMCDEGKLVRASRANGSYGVDASSIRNWYRANGRRS